MIYTPHDYQVEGRNWLLSHSSAGLFFPPGLGKTATVLDTFRYLKSYGYINTMLVIAPLRVCYMVWPEEVQEWDEFKHFDVKVIHGKDKESQLAKVKDIGVINPEGLEWLFAQKSWRNKFQGQMLVCDESTLFKNYTSNRFKLLKNYLDSFSRRYILTGTPVPNGLVQLWPQIYILDKGKRLGRYITHFKQKYFIEDRRCYSLELREGAEDIIYSLVDDIVMHKSLSELDLPDISYTNIKVELPNHARLIYDTMKKEMAVEFEKGYITAESAAVKTSKLSQIANGALYDNEGNVVHIHDKKLDALLELRESLQGRQLLVAYIFNHDLARLQAAFPGVPHIGGGVSGEALNAVATKWNKGEISLLFVQPQAAGHGLNLQKGNCSNVCWYGIPADLEIYDQLNRRVYRQGVKGDVIIHHIIAKHTIDSHILRALKEKDRIQQCLLDAVLK